MLPGIRPSGGVCQDPGPRSGTGFCDCLRKKTKGLAH